MLWQDSGLAFILRLKPQMMVNGYHMFLLQFTVSSSFIFFWSDVWFLLLEWLLDGLAGFLTDLFIKKNLGNNEARYQRYKVCFNVFLVACSYSVWNFFIFSFLLLFLRAWSYFSLCWSFKVVLLFLVSLSIKWVIVALCISVPCPFSN